MITDDCDEELQQIAGAIVVTEQRAWARPSLLERLRSWFMKRYGDEIARRRHMVEEEARALGAVRIVWKGESGCEIEWSAHG